MGREERRVQGLDYSESQREGSSSNDVQYLPAASTSSSAGSLPAANTSNGGQYKTETADYGLRTTDWV